MAVKYTNQSNKFILGELGNSTGQQQMESLAKAPINQFNRVMLDTGIITSSINYQYNTIENLEERETTCLDNQDDRLLERPQV